MKIGIQGDIGSSNHSVAIHFARLKNWFDYEIVPLRSTRGVLSAICAEEVDFGIFAWESASGGLVAETQRAIKEFPYNKVDEIVIEIEHALLKEKGASVDRNATVFIYSHPQALIEHKRYLSRAFPKVKYCEASDTGFAAKQLSAGVYPDNSLTISPPLCAQVYNLEILEHNIPYDKESWTRFFIVKKQMLIHVYQGKG